MIKIREFLRLGMMAGVCIVCVVSLVFAEEDSNELFNQGNLAFSASDYTTACYFYQRIIESKGWNDFPQRMDVLRKMAMIEESLAQFDKAVNHYQELLEVLSQPANRLAEPTMRQYYIQRYAENLERIGRYEQAGRLLLQLVRDSDPGMRPVYLKLLVSNYGYQKLSDTKLEELKAFIIPQFLDQVGWELAELYSQQGHPQESHDLFEKLWPIDPVQACSYVSTLRDLYSAADQLDDFLARIHALTDLQNPNSDSFIMLEVALLEDSEKGEDALKNLEQYVLNKVGVEQSSDTEQLLSLLPSTLLDRWVDLLVRFRGEESGIQILRGILEKVPMDMNRRKRLSELLLKVGRQKEAVELWQGWAESQSNTPLAVLNAAQEIFSLGDTDSARTLLNDLQGRIPPSLAWKQGQSALQFGDYPGAIAAFNIAVVSGEIPVPMITSVILQNAQTKTKHDELVSNFIQFASGHPVQSIPEWIKTPLLQFGVHPSYRTALEGLAESDTTGVWKYNIACEALKHGYDQWALSLLQSIPEDSLYRSMADEKRSMILGLNPSRTEQGRAADLMMASLGELLSATPTVDSKPFPLNSVVMDRLLQYAELRLHAFQPNEALIAIRSIESSSNTLENSLSEMDQARIAYDRAWAWSELASFDPAIQRLESIQVMPYQEDAQLLLAKIYLAQRKTDLANTILHNLVEDGRFWRRANDALTILTDLEPLVGDSLLQYCDAILYELQGRVNSVIPPLRQLAVDFYGEDMEEWIRFSIGKLHSESGDDQSAREEWERLLLDVDDPVIQGMTRLELLRLSESASAEIANITEYQTLMIELPNTLFADLARLEMQKKLGKE